MIALEEFLDRLVAALPDHDFPVDADVGDVRAELSRCAQLVVVGSMEEAGECEPGVSKVGGAPDLPSDLEWPTETRGDSPLPFVCQVNFAEVRPHDSQELLPARGMLWVFSITDPDRAYGYEIDDDTTAILFRAEPGQLERPAIPELRQGNASIEERRLAFGPGLQLSEKNDEDQLESFAFDTMVGRSIDKACASMGGRKGPIRLLGHALFFREENLETFEPDTETTLLAIDGYDVAKRAFGEGSFAWTTSKTDLAQGSLEKAWLTFEPGT